MKNTKRILLVLIMMLILIFIIFKIIKVRDNDRPNKALSFKNTHDTLSNKEASGVSENKDIYNLQNEELISSTDNVVDGDTTIYEAVEVYPIFEGGMSNLPKFLGENLRYPESARLNLIQGEVKVKFVVEKDGSVTNVSIEKGFDKACEEEAIRVVKLFPKWTPGKINGNAVRTKLILPINYSLQTE